MNFPHSPLNNSTQPASFSPPPHLEAGFDDGHHPMHPRPRSHSFPGRERSGEDHHSSFQPPPQHMRGGFGGRGRGGRGGAGRGSGHYPCMPGRQSEDEQGRYSPGPPGHHHHQNIDRHHEQHHGVHDHGHSFENPRHGPHHHHRKVGGHHGLGHDQHHDRRGGHHLKGSERPDHRHDHPHFAGRGRSPHQIIDEKDGSQTQSEDGEEALLSDSSTISDGPTRPETANRVQLTSYASMDRELNALAQRLAIMMQASRDMGGKGHRGPPPRHHQGRHDHSRPPFHPHGPGHQNHGHYIKSRCPPPPSHGHEGRRKRGQENSSPPDSCSKPMRGHHHRQTAPHHHAGDHHHPHHVHFGPSMNVPTI
jgi:hypothetical protein